MTLLAAVKDAELPKTGTELLKDETSSIYSFRRDRWMLVVVSVSLVLKLTLALSVEPITPRNDENAYLHYAHEIENHGSYPDLFRPPFYPAFLAVIFKLGGNTEAVRVLQVLLSTLTIFLVFRIAYVSYGIKVARLAAGIFAFDPVLVGFSHLLWSETLFVLIVLCAVDFLITNSGLQRRRSLFAAGILLGLAGLTRPQILTFAPFFLTWIVVQSRRRGEEGGSAKRKAPQGARGKAWSASGILLLGCATVVLPWSARNLIVTGTLTVVDNNGAFNFLVGTDPSAAFVDKDDCWNFRWGRVDDLDYRDAVAQQGGEASRRAIELAVENIRKDPLLYVRKSVWEAGHLWTLDSFILRHLRNGWYGSGLPQWVVVFSVPLCAGFTLMLFTLGFVGQTLQRSSRLGLLAGLFLVHATALSGLVYSLSRYSVPMRPFLAISGAWLVLNHSELLNEIRNARRLTTRGAILLFLLVALVAVWIRDMPLLWDMIVTGGAAFRFRVLAGPT